MREALYVTAVFAIAIVLSYWFYLAISAQSEKEKRYWYWDATVTFVWYDGVADGKDYALGKSRYKVRLPSGNHVAARSFLNESFSLYDCVKVREHLSATIAPIPFEIIGRASECWQPKQRTLE